MITEYGKPSRWKQQVHCVDPDSEGLASADDIAAFDMNELVGLNTLMRIRDEVARKRLSLFVTVEGRHRSGKSVATAAIGALFSTQFERHMDKFVVKDAQGMLDVVAMIEKKKIKFPFIMVDEAGASMNSAEWFDKIQKAIVKTMTIIGYLHPTIFFISPIKDFILKGIRKMSHMHIRVSRANDKYAVLKIFKMSYNSFNGKTFPKYYRIRLFGMPIKVKGIKISLPPPHVYDQYKEVELGRKPEMLEDIRTDVRRGQVKEMREVLDYDEVAKWIIKPDNVVKYTTRNSKPTKLCLDHNLIRAQLRCKIDEAKTIKVMAEKLWMDNLDEKIAEMQKKKAADQAKAKKQLKKEEKTAAVDIDSFKKQIVTEDSGGK
jgi:hypothetical protein